MNVASESKLGSSAKLRNILEPVIGAAFGATAWIGAAGISALRDAQKQAGAESWVDPLLTVISSGFVAVLTPLIAWAALAIVLINVRKSDKISYRLISSVLAALLVSVPFIVFMAVQAAATNNLDGLGLIGVAIPLLFPLLAFVLHLSSALVIALFRHVPGGGPFERGTQ